MLELLAKRALASEPGFTAKEVRWAIQFDSQEGFTGLVELGKAGQKRNRGRLFPKCPDLTQPELVSGPSPRSHFLVETASVVTLYKADADKKTAQKHKFFVYMLEEAGKTVPYLAKIAGFMKDGTVLEKIRKEMSRHKVRPTDKVTFGLDGEFPLEKDDWHEWWRSFRSGLASTGSTTPQDELFRCFVTGELVVPTRTHPKIKDEKLAVVGGAASGDALISCDKEAYCSYGLKQSFNAATSEKAARAYADALKELIRENSKHLTGALVVYWFKEKVDPGDDPFPFLTDAPQIRELNARERMRELLDGIETGKRPDLRGNRYYVMAMSGAGGRVMVRDWVEGDFSELVRNVNRWFDDLDIVLHDGRRSSPPRFIAVLEALSGDRDQLPAPLASKLWRVAVRGEEFPYQVLAQSAYRRRSEVLRGEDLNAIGMALIKAYHLRKYRKEGSTLVEMLKPELSEDFPNVAYQCGRLLAALAELQRAALGAVGAGVVKRYYAAASTTPALVLGRLISNSQHHLNKLESSSSPYARWYENTIAEIVDRIKEPLPRTLTLEEQSLFALGYYHQLAAFRAGKKGNESKKES